MAKTVTPEVQPAAVEELSVTQPEAHEPDAPVEVAPKVALNIPENFVPMKASGASVSYCGLEFPVVNGIVAVPADAVDIFLELGLVLSE